MTLPTIVHLAQKPIGVCKMYIVKNAEGTTVAICTRREDAEAYLGAAHLDDTFYTIEEQKEVDKQEDL